MCSWICASVLPPLRRGSLICSQICPSERCLPCHRSSARHATADAPARRTARSSHPGGRSCSACRSAPLSSRAAHHQRAVRMHVGALRRSLADRMAVEAARVLDHLAGFDEQRARALGAVADRGEAVGRAEVRRARRAAEGGGQEKRDHRFAAIELHRSLSTRRGRRLLCPDGLSRWQSVLPNDNATPTSSHLPAPSSTRHDHRPDLASASRRAARAQGRDRARRPAQRRLLLAARPRRPAHPGVPAGRERLRRRLVRAACGAEGAALPGDVRPDPAGRRLGAVSQGPLVVLEPHPEGRPVPALHPPARASAASAATTRRAATRRCST